MKPFVYHKANSIKLAQHQVQKSGAGTFIAGGTNLLDLMKKNIALPANLVDLTGLELKTISHTTSGLRIGALVTNSTVATDKTVLENYPLLAKAILAGASPQIRNMATTGGNMMQRTRCPYFYDVAMPCNKRKPGTGCGAKEGLHKISAIFGASENCVAVHPSDMCVGLVALDASVTFFNNGKETTIPFEDFHRLPGTTPHVDNNLPKSAIIVRVDLPQSNFNKNYHYLKIRDRTSYAFALVSVAAALSMENNIIKDARLASGGVAHKPWRFKEAEAFMKGKKPSEKLFKETSEYVIKNAAPLAQNQYKIKLLQNAVQSALQQAVTI